MNKKVPLLASMLADVATLLLPGSAYEHVEGSAKKLALSLADDLSKGMNSKVINSIKNPKHKAKMVILVNQTTPTMWDMVRNHLQIHLN